MHMHIILNIFAQTEKKKNTINMKICIHLHMKTYKISENEAIYVYNFK